MTTGGFTNLGGNVGTWNTGRADGNPPGSTGTLSVGAPNIHHPAMMVGLLVIGAVILVIAGVVGLRASGEVVV